MALLVVSSLLALIGLAALIGGTVVLVFDQTQRDARGYLMTSMKSYSTGTFALVSDSYRASTPSEWFVASDQLGTVRIDVESTAPVFVGIGAAAAVSAYLDNVRREEASGFGVRASDFHLVHGGAPTSPPEPRGFWAAQAAGAGRHTLHWKAQNGEWRIVLMNRDASAGVDARLRIGASFPHLLAIALGILGGGAALLLFAAAGIYAGLRRDRPPGE